MLAGYWSSLPAATRANSREMPREQPSAPEPTTPVALVVLAWLVVSAPLLWGVLQTLKKSAALFQ
jgi:hypothetical protein